MVVAQTRKKTKTHIHTNHPGQALEIASSLGDLNNIKDTVSSALKYYRDMLQSIEPFNEKLYVLTSILTYSYKRLLELMNHDLFH